VLCSWLLAGCTTVADLRQSPPARTATVQGRYLPLAACSLDLIDDMRSEDRVEYEPLDLSTARTARILGIARMPGGLFYRVPEPVLELAFQQTDDGKVVIESRTGVGGHVIEPRVWRLVERCAGTALKVVPPPR
jgi:hypothetical protein